MKYYPRRGFDLFDEMFDGFFPKTVNYDEEFMRTDVY